MEHSRLSGFGPGKERMKIAGTVVAAERVTHPLGSAEFDVVWVWALLMLGAASADGHVRCVSTSPPDGVTTAVEADGVGCEAGCAQLVQGGHRLRTQALVAAQVDHEEAQARPINRNSRAGAVGRGTHAGDKAQVGASSMKGHG
jgi:hypothetical protein